MYRVYISEIFRIKYKFTINRTNDVSSQVFKIVRNEAVAVQLINIQQSKYINDILNLLLLILSIFVKDFRSC